MKNFEVKEQLNLKDTFAPNLKGTKNTHHMILQ